MNRYKAFSVSAVFLCIALAQAAFAAPSVKNPEVVMQVKGRGAMTIELYQKDAPKTVAHFLKLVKEKFYNGILFHRVIPGFVAQAGDPNSKKIKGSLIRSLSDQQVFSRYHLGAGGSGTNIPFEQNSHTNQPGTLAMALSQPQSDTGDSQFFINLVYNASLDGNYCVFGKVVKGMKVLKSIRQGDRILTVKLLTLNHKSAPHKK